MRKISFVLMLFVASCNSNATKEPQAAKDTSAMVAAPASGLDSVAVDNKKDPVCEMPTKGNVSDTLHYEGKVLGFCSTECKGEFAKNPKQYIAAAGLQK